MEKSLSAFTPIVALLIKWSGIAATDGRGKVGGSVFSKGRSGSYVRNKVTPVNRRTSYQQTSRVLLAYFAQAWRSLTQAQILAWNAVAAASSGVTNIFGDLIKPTGLNFYIELNRNLVSIGVAAISNPPILMSVGNMVSIVPEADVSASEMFLFGLNVAGTNVVPANTSLIISASPTVSAGVSFIGSNMRNIAILDAADNTDTTNFWADYVAKFGAPLAGAKIFIGSVAINKTTGQAGVPIVQSLIVVA